MGDRVALEQMPEELQSLLGARVERLGYLGEFFQLAAHQPDALAGFIRFTESLKDALPARLVECIALTVASLTSNDYERVQHERLALTLGMSEEEIHALVSGNGLAIARLSEAEVSAVELARCVVHGQGRGCPDAYRQVTGLVGIGQGVACLMTASRYLAHATMANTWELDPPVRYG